MREYPELNYVASVENLQQLMDDMKKSLKSTNDKLDFSLGHIKQLNDKLGYLEQRLRQAGVRLRKS